LLKQVSIIVINYNSTQYTINCVNSILKFTDNTIDYEIIVVDNNSEPDEKTKLLNLTENAKIKIVYSKINLGFAGGNMLGVQHAQGNYYLFINNDSVLLKDCIKEFYNYCIKNTNTGIVSSYTKSEEGDLQFNYSHFPTISSKYFGVSISKLFNNVNYPPKVNTYTAPFNVDLVGGALMFVNAEIFAKLGGFDTTFFLYCEEEDLALRITKAGYNVTIIPDITVQHFGSKSTEKSLAIKKEFYISFFYFYRKHYGLFKTFLLRKYLVIKHLKNIFKKDGFTLILFILQEAHFKHSLKHKQMINL